MMMKFRSEDVRTPLIPLPALRTGLQTTRMLKARIRKRTMMKLRF